MSRSLIKPDPRGKFDKTNWHTNARPWDGDAHMVPKSDKPTIGLELELECFEDHSRVAWLAVDHGAVAERDATLDPDTGIECIFPPMDANVMFKAQSPLVQFLKKVNDERLVPKDQRTNVGTHINVGTQGWSELKKNAVCFFFSVCKSFCEPMADREVYYSAPAALLGALKYNPDNEWFVGHANYNCTKNEQTIQPGNWMGRNLPKAPEHTHRLEVRIFLGTSSKKVLQERVEFVLAVVGYVDHILATNKQVKSKCFDEISALVYKDRPFYDWLFHQTGGAEFKHYKARVLKSGWFSPKQEAAA